LLAERLGESVKLSVKQAVMGRDRESGSESADVLSGPRWRDWRILSCSAMATPPCRFCFNCKAGIADRMTPDGHDPLQLE
jgi:hypothetical protein